MKNTIIILVTVILISGAAAVSYRMGSQSGRKGEDANLKQLFDGKQKAGLLPGLDVSKASPDSVVSGATVTKVDMDKNEIIVEIRNTYDGGDLVDFAFEPEKSMKVLKVGNDTVLEKSSFKSQEQIENDMKSASNQQGNNDNQPGGMGTVPSGLDLDKLSIFQYASISLSEIKEGDRISFYSDQKEEEGDTISVKRITIMNLSSDPIHVDGNISSVPPIMNDQPQIAAPVLPEQTQNNQ